MSEKLSFTGVVDHVFEQIQVTDNFAKREFAVLQTGTEYPQNVKFQVSNAKLSLLDNISTGDNITVYYNIRGNKREKNGEPLYFTTLEAWKIEKTGNTVQPAQPEVSKPAQFNGDNREDDSLPF